MNVVMYGSSARIYGEDVQTCKQLPVGTYDVCFNMRSGFSLSRRADLSPNEVKIYGSHTRKVEKVLRTFKLVHRNLGVILSGYKGSGKSLFVRILSREALANGIPVIVVSGCFPGIADFISSIEQEVLVVFDEFEKIFSSTEDEHDPQNELLPLFDGMDNGKKLFVITCNDTDLLNDCLLNRPGRFHYHFDVKNPTEDEIREYMNDNLLPEYKGAIEPIIRLSAITDITYDFLRAIAFEINQGYSLAETMQDLNISDDKDTSFDVEAMFENGLAFRAYNVSIDLNRQDKDFVLRIRTYNNNGVFDEYASLSLSFRERDLVMRNGALTLDPGLLKECSLSYDDVVGQEEAQRVNDGYYSAKNIKSITVKRSNFGMTRFAV